MEQRQVALESSRRPAHGDAVAGPALAAGERVEVTVVLRENPDGPTVDMTLDTLAAQPLAQRRYLTHRQFEAVHGASAADVNALKRFAVRNGLTVDGVDRGVRQVRLSGTAAQMQRAFGVQLQQFRTRSGTTYRSYAEAHPFIASELGQAVVGVVGLDNRPFARPCLRGVRIGPDASPNAMNPPDVAKAYDWPTVDGTGMTIGIIELGGQVTDADITAYFQGLGLPKPTVKHVSVDGAQPTNDPGGANVEVALDVEVIGAMAPGCTIVIYDAPNTEQGFMHAVAAAANDTANRPSVVSISWGGPENSWTTAGMQGMDAAFAAGNAQGVTYCAAAGDNGATDGVSDGQFHADHPASSPHTIACGGTTLVTLNGARVSESVWGGTPGDGATGGDDSSVFARPPWQANVTTQPQRPGGTAGRWVADVSGNADPQTGWNVTSDGQSMSVGGTSAVAPMWSALFALAAKTIGKPLGDPHSLMYSINPAAYNDITSGNNNTSGSAADGYSATAGYDPPTGLGTPVGQTWVQEMGAATPALCPPHFALRGTAQLHRGLGLAG